jgi:hypothetical protein
MEISKFNMNNRSGVIRLKVGKHMEDGPTLRCQGPAEKTTAVIDVDWRDSELYRYAK